jgi:hypothetical protein
VFNAGYVAANSNIIDYVTIATTGNATSFGQLIGSFGGGLSACSSTTTGIFAGGDSSTGRSSVIQYITVASTGNATSWGNLLDGNRNLAACSNINGGLQ